jgi:YHS domain-containing protein/thiol-disulfide isomerase/thioredoxin
MPDAFPHALIHNRLLEIRARTFRMTAFHQHKLRFRLFLAGIGLIATVMLPGEAVSGVAWHESYEAATVACRSSQRPVLLVFTADWCEACQHLDSRLWANPEAAALVTACYEPVLVNVDANPQLARRMGVTHIPSACVVDANEQLLTTFDLPPTAATFVAQAARALHQTGATTPSPVATPPARFPNESWQQGQQVQAPPRFPAEGTAAPFAGSSTPSQSPAVAGTTSAATTVGSRYAEQNASAFGGSQQPSAVVVAQPQAGFGGYGQPTLPPSASGPPASATPPWLANNPTTATAPYGVGNTPYPAPQQPPPEARQAGYSPYPQTPPAGSTAGIGTGPANAFSTVPPAASAIDSSATVTDRSDAEQQQKADKGWLSTLQKPFSFMMPKSDEEERPLTTAAPATASPHPVGLDGYCPVTLAEQATWSEGRAQWGVQHRGRTYLFAGANEQQRFLANPDRYAPALSGDDPVLAFEAGDQIPGQRRYGVTYQGRIYLFSSLDTRSRFAANPQAYASRVRMAESLGENTNSLYR